MAIDSINPTATTGTQITPPKAEAASKLNADFDLFLNLLTTQMKNQDPLDPVDSAQYTQQLVQYSAVEQAIEQTGTLKDIRDRLDRIEISLVSAAATPSVRAPTQEQGA